MIAQLQKFVLQISVNKSNAHKISSVTVAVASIVNAQMIVSEESIF